MMLSQHLLRQLTLLMASYYHVATAAAEKHWHWLGDSTSERCVSVQSSCSDVCHSRKHFHKYVWCLGIEFHCVLSFRRYQMLL